MFDVLFLLPVAGRLFQCADDEGRGGRYDADGSLSILDGELDCDTETFLDEREVSA